MNPKLTKLIIFLIIVVLLFKAFRHFSSPGGPSIESFYVVNEDGESSEKVKVSIYYEALCPDSRYFIEHQLLPTYEKLRNHLLVDLVPYGKAQTIIDNNGEPDFECQHGSVECFANKIHACVIKHVTDEYTRLKYIACMIEDNQFPDQANEKCGKQVNFDSKPIIQCAREITGSLLLKHYGERTHSLNPSVSFIPTIELNESQSTVAQAVILKDLHEAACTVFKTPPDKCLDALK